jgi:hypothetical protein
MNRLHLLAGLALPLLFTGCDAEVGEAAERREKVTIAADADGQVRFDLPFAKGNIKLPAAMMGHSDFDIDGVKMFPGGKITGFNVDAQEGKADVNLAFTAPAAPAEVRSYFLKEFEAKGVDAEAKGEGIEARSKEGDTFTMAFAPQGSATQGSIRILAKN